MFSPWRGDVPQHVTKVYLYSVTIIKENAVDTFHVIFTSFIVRRSCFDLWHILLQHLIIKFYCVYFGFELFSGPMRDWHKGINHYYFEWQNWIIHVFTICNLFKIELIQVDLPCFGRMMHTAQFSVPEVAPTKLTKWKLANYYDNRVTPSLVNYTMLW